MAALMPQGKQQYFDLNGNPLSGGFLYTYASGTTTPQATYTDASGATPNANPIVLNSRGEANVFWGTSAYKIVLKDSADAEIYTVDNLQAQAGIADLGSSAAGKGAALIGFDGGTIADFFKTKNNRVVDSIAALRALDKTKYTRAFVTGYYAAGDGGGGPYWYDSTDTTSSDNGGTIIVASDGGRWKLVYGKAVTLRQFGAKGDSTGSTGTGQDATTYIQAALTWATTTTMRKAEIWAEEGIYRTTAALTAAAGFKLHGTHPRSKGPGGTDFGGGSWLYFDHAGKGISVTNSGGYFTDVTLEEIGTCRNQPAPTSSWAPNAHDYDFYCFGVSDVVLRSVLMLNPTKGVGIFGNITNGGGRLELYNFRAQAFQQGIVIDTVYDVVRLDHIHIWPFWRDDSLVHAYTMANLDAIYSLRNDNPMISNVFTIFARAGLRIGQNANGGTSKVHCVNADFDRGNYGVWIDNSVTTGCTGQFENITHQGETAFVGSKGIFVEGNNSALNFGSFESNYSWQNAVRVQGTGNTISFGAAKAVAFDQSATNVSAFEALSGNKLVFATIPVVGSSGGTGGRFASTGTIVCDNWRSFTPSVSSQTGTITTLGAVSGLYKVVGDTVTLEFDITITTNGTAAGDVRFTLPFGSPLQNFSGHGREMAVNGKSLSVIGQASGTVATILNYDNTYCGGNGVQLIGTLQYRSTV